MYPQHSARLSVARGQVLTCESRTLIRFGLKSMSAIITPMRLGKNWGDSILVMALSILPAFTALKIGSLQLEDCVLLLILALSCAKLVLVGFKIQTLSVLFSLLRGYLIFLIFLSLFAILSLRLKSYPLEDVSILKTPIFYSASRLLQFVAMVCGLFWIAEAMIRERRYLDMAMNLFWRTGIVSCIYAIISYCSLRFGGIDLFGAYLATASLRARGFFNEGGPFGLYIVSVLMIGLLRNQINAKRMGLINLSVIFTALILSQSKAAFFAIAFLCCCAVFTLGSFWKRVVTVLVALSILAFLAVSIHIGVLLRSYLKTYENIETRVALLGNDPNVVLGRIAGAYIVPRMIKEHPITGIGIGNYPLMRNNPKFLGDLPSIRYEEDQPGLGLLGDASELGIPLTCLLFVLMCMPYWVCKKGARIVGIVSVTQLTVHLFGVQLTFFYPWLITACALAASVHYKDRIREQHAIRIVFRWREWHIANSVPS
jgi:O-Antigen ligase